MAFEHDQFARFTQQQMERAKPVGERARDHKEARLRRRRANALVAVKVALLCVWLVHELASGFDESRCLSLASSNSSPPPPLLSSTAQPIQNTETKQTVVPQRPNVDEQPLKDSGGTKMLGTRVAMKSPLSAEPIVKDGVEQVQQRQGTKRRRKVILRRRLLRKGASATSVDANPMSKGTVRRVVWRMVPLRRLPGEESEMVDEEHLAGVPQFAGPVRTKTGTVMMLRETDRRRLARRRTSAPGLPKMEQKRQEEKPTENVELAPTQKLSASPTAQRAVMLPAHSQPAVDVPEQMTALVASALCLSRTVFDCWVLLQCFCSVLFLLGLHLRRRCLAMISVVMDVISIAVALIFGLSSVMFVLILVLLLHNFSSSTLLSFIVYSISILVGIAVYAWGTFCLLRVLDETTKRGKKVASGEEMRIPFR